MRWMLTVLVVVMLTATADAWWWSSDDKTVQATGAVDAQCGDWGRSGDCRFFDCFEARLPCGPDYYILRFAKKYCHRFANASSTFTPEGRRFLSASQRCVSRGLLPYYRQDSLTCEHLEDSGVQMTSPCYSQSGFCRVINSNTRAFLAVFEMGDASDLLSELVSLAGECGGGAMQNLISAIGSRITSIFSG